MTPFSKGIVYPTAGRIRVSGNKLAFLASSQYQKGAQTGEKIIGGFNAKSIQAPNDPDSHKFVGYGIKLTSFNPIGPIAMDLVDTGNGFSHTA